MKPLILLFVVTITGNSFACFCIEPVDKKAAQNLIGDADFIFYGTALTSIYLHSELTEFYNNRKNGYNVIIKIDSVIKGDLKIGDEVIIYQNSGNCNELFNYGERKLIIGHKITKFRISSTLEMDYKEGIVLGQQSEKENKFYNQAIQSKTGVWTNSCQVYTPNSRSYKRLFELIN